jgi:RNA polymerase sigma factor (sigma-70 family)
VKSTTDHKLADNTLVDRVLKGDTAAFSLIISNTERLVAHIVFKMISHEEDKKDLAQDIYLKAFHKLSTFKFQSKLSTWIGQIAYNTCFTYLEKKKLIFFDDHYADDETRDGPFADTDTEGDFFNDELAQILQIETAKLSPVYKTLITLFHKEELSHAEIAVITQLPEGTIKSYLYRARQLLKNNLLQTYKKEEL